MFMQQLLSAVTCLRGRSIVHRDIKTQNLPHGHAPKNEQVDNFMGCVSDVTFNFLGSQELRRGQAAAFESDCFCLDIWQKSVPLPASCLPLVLGESALTVAAGGKHILGIKRCKRPR